MKTAGLAEVSPAWSEAWEKSQSSFSPPGLPVFEAGPLDAALHTLRMPEAVNEAFRAARPFFADRPALQRLAWHLRCRLYAYGLTLDLKARPRLPAALGPEADMLDAFLALAGLPFLEERHRRRGIDPAVTYETVSDIALWLIDFHDREGRWGFRQLDWSLTYLRDNLVQLGRLQFQPWRFPYPFHVYRRRRDGQVCLLAGDGIPFTADGQFPSSRPAEPPAWTSRLRVEGVALVGHPVSESGSVQARPVSLPAADWDKVFCPDSPALAIHIPASGPLDDAACAESIRRAGAFFPRHYPEAAFDAFMCNSWLMDSQFADYLPAASNIL
ncbi:MAG: DUF5596 domain-containing protein, partial [Lentisphaerae bacterium]|nr:DUF5596 domain-containing protein [Lentisphaerota bacterium]